MVRLPLEIERVDMSGKVAEEGEDDVDDEVCAAAVDDEDADGGDEDRYEDEEDCCGMAGELAWGAVGREGEEC